MVVRGGSLGLIGLLAAALAPGGSVSAPERLVAHPSRDSTATYGASDPIAIDFAASGMQRGERTTLELVLRDEHGTVLARSTLPVLADGAGVASVRYTPPARRLGYYELSARLGDGTALAAEGSRPAGIVSFARVVDPANRVDYGEAKSRFGMQGGFSVQAVVLPYLGARWVLRGSDWARYEPDRAGQFAETRAANAAKGKRWPPQVAETENPAWSGGHWHTYSLASVVQSVPNWARGPGRALHCERIGPLGPAGGAGLNRYASAYARAFAEDVPDQPQRGYQVTWEPADWCFPGTADQLVALYAASVPAIRAADPHALIAGPTLFLDDASTRQLEGLWAAGLARWIDVLSIHPYLAQGKPEAGAMVPILRSQLAALARAKGRQLPFIGTEHGTIDEQHGGAAGQAAYNLRSTLTMLGEGAWFDFGFFVHDTGTPVERYGYYFNLDPALRFGPARISPKPGAPAFAAMTWLIDGSDSMGAMPGLSGNQAGYRFRRGRTVTAALWDWKGASRLAVPPGATRCDWMGNCAPLQGATVDLLPEPVYLVWK